MLQNIIFDFLTSLPVLGVLAVVGLVALVGAGLGIIPLAYRALAHVAGVVALGLLLFLAGYRLADERATVEALRHKLEFADKQLTVQRTITAATEAARAELVVIEAKLQRKVDAYALEIKAAPNPACLATPGDVKRLLNIR